MHEFLEIEDHGLFLSQILILYNFPMLLIYAMPAEDSMISYIFTLGTEFTGRYGGTYFSINAKRQRVQDQWDARIFRRLIQFSLGLDPVISCISFPPSPQLSALTGHSALRHESCGGYALGFIPSSTPSYGPSPPLSLNFCFPITIDQK